jgi:hypothetical protein
MRVTTFFSNFLTNPATAPIAPEKPLQNRNRPGLMLRALVGAALVLAAAPQAALASRYPSVLLGLSGTLVYTTNNNLTMGVPITRVSYTGQSLIKLLNASANATNTMQQVTGTNQIPAGSHFLWNPDEQSLTITNDNGFSFPLEGAGYGYGALLIDEEQLIGSYSLDAGKRSGSETDVTGIYFYFYDGNANPNEIELYGTAALLWTYGAAESGSQKVILNVTMQGCGNDESTVNGFEAIARTFSATGMNGAGRESTSDVPFYLEW